MRGCSRSVYYRWKHLRHCNWYLITAILGSLFVQEIMAHCIIFSIDSESRLLTRLALTRVIHPPPPPENIQNGGRDSELWFSDQNISLSFFNVFPPPPPPPPVLRAIQSLIILTYILKGQLIMVEQWLLWLYWSEINEIWIENISLVIEWIYAFQLEWLSCN